VGWGGVGETQQMGRVRRGVTQTPAGGQGGAAAGAQGGKGRWWERGLGGGAPAGGYSSIAAGREGGRLQLVDSKMGVINRHLLLVTAACAHLRV
jgi:hypothetical protein